MTVLTVPAGIEDFFRQLTIATDICNSDGKILGRFIPLSETKSEFLNHTHRTSDAEEMNRRKASG